MHRDIMNPELKSHDTHLAETTHEASPNLVCLGYDELSADCLAELAAVTRAAFAEYKQANINFRGMKMTAETLFASMAASKETVFIMRVGESIVAYCRGYMARENGVMCLHCETMAVLPSCRGQGYARRVASALEQWGLGLGAEYAMLDTSVFAHNALRFHRLRGYKPWYYRHYHQRTYISIHMRKDFGKPYPAYRRVARLWYSYLRVRLWHTRRGERTLACKMRDLLARLKRSLRRR